MSGWSRRSEMMPITISSGTSAARHDVLRLKADRRPRPRAAFHRWRLNDAVLLHQRCACPCSRRAVLTKSVHENSPPAGSESPRTCVSMSRIVNHNQRRPTTKNRVARRKPPWLRDRIRPRGRHPMKVVNDTAIEAVGGLPRRHPDCARAAPGGALGIKHRLCR